MVIYKKQLESIMFKTAADVGKGLRKQIVPMMKSKATFCIPGTQSQYFALVPKIHTIPTMQTFCILEKQKIFETELRLI